MCPSRETLSVLSCKGKARRNPYSLPRVAASSQALTRRVALDQAPLLLHLTQQNRKGMLEHAHTVTGTEQLGLLWQHQCHRLQTGSNKVSLVLLLTKHPTKTQLL